MRVIEPERHDLDMAIAGWGYFARRDVDRTHLALAFYCHAKVREFSPIALAWLYSTIFSRMVEVGGVPVGGARS